MTSHTDDDVVVRKITPTERRLRNRIADLRTLEGRINIELQQARLDLNAYLAERRAPQIRRSRYVRPPCGTEAGYQWHRHNEPDRWPLPVEDPCGCRTAHRAHGRAKYPESKRARERRERAAQTNHQEAS